MEATIEKKEKRGGAGRGQGRKKGYKEPHTITKEKISEQVKMQIFGMAKKLIQSQAIVAFGTHKMIAVKKGADGKITTETIRDEDRMEALLADGVYGKDYLIVEGREPDAKAADMLLNRALGKATETIDLGNKDGQPFLLKLD